MNYPKYINLPCKECGRRPLTIYAYELSKDEAVPVLVCNPVYGCGKVFELSEYDLGRFKYLERGEEGKGL